MSAPEFIEVAPGIFALEEAGPPMFSAPTQNQGGTRTIKRGHTQTVLQGIAGKPGETITLCLTRRDNPAPGQDATSEFLDAPLRAQVQFGAGAASEIVRCDWLNGLNLTVPAGGFQLACEWVPDAAFPAELDILVGALVTVNATRPPASGTCSQAKLTDRFSVNNAGGFVAAIPTRAHAMRFFCNRPALYGGFQLDFVDALKAARPPSWSVIADPAVELPLGGANRSVIVNNNSGLNALCAIVWSIAL